ncbi:Mediator of RNA polymerase II transcription subunit 30, partial [Lemmus lemmus]
FRVEPGSQVFRDDACVAAERKWRRRFEIRRVGSGRAERPSAMSTPPLAPAGMAPGPFGGPQAQQQAAREVNTATLCRIGQETVQDIVYRTMEIFQLLRNMQLPNGVTYHTGAYQDRLTKLQDHLRQLSILFRKLRLVYDKCNENCGGMDPIPVEQLIPYVDEDGSKNDDRAGPPRFASEERREIAEVNKVSYKSVHFIFQSP